MDRRNFIKLTAVTGSAATLASCGNPEHQLIRFVPDEDLDAGHRGDRRTACARMCSAGCGTTVRVMQGDVDTVRNGQAGVVTMSLAKKLEGNPTHPVSQGDALRRAARRRSRSRITPIGSRSRSSGAARAAPATFSRSPGTRRSRSSSASSTRSPRRRRRRRWRAGRGPGASARTRSDRRSSSSGSARRRRRTFELFSDDVLRRANVMSFGHEQLPTFDLARVALRDFVRRRLPRHLELPRRAQRRATAACGRAGRAFAARSSRSEPRMSLTGASADEWVPIRPGTEGVLALGLAHVIMREQAAARGRGRPRGRARSTAGRKGLADYTPEAVEQKTA